MRQSFIDQQLESIVGHLIETLKFKVKELTELIL